MPVISDEDLQKEIENRRGSLMEDVRNFVGASQSRGFISTVDESGPVIIIRLRHSATEEPKEMAADRSVEEATAEVRKARDEALGALEGVRAENKNLSETVESLEGQVAELTEKVAQLTKAPGA